MDIAAVREMKGNENAGKKGPRRSVERHGPGS
jgi:hypothetical protein